jgi:type IV secretory pathway TraG/TraD family ATPase VirD4
VAAGETATPVFRAVLDLALKEALGRGRRAGRVIIVLDEFSLLPRVAHLDAGLNFGRSLGLRFVVGTQNVGQVLDAYGPERGMSVLSAFGSVFAFRMFDEPSRTFVRQRFGTNRKLVRYDGALKTRGLGELVVEGSVIEDWDLSGLGVGECVVGLPTGPPVLFTFEPPRRTS